MSEVNIRFLVQMAQQPVDDEETKSSETTAKKCKDLYSDHDLEILKEFQSLLDYSTTCQSAWTPLDDNKNSEDINTKYIKNGSYNVPISVSTAELDFNSYFFSLSNQIKDKDAITKFHTLVIKNVVIHNFNAVNRISQFQVQNANKSLGIADRDFIVREIGFFFRADGTLLHFKELEKKDNAYACKVIYLLCSLDKTDKYYKSAMADDARGIMYRCGACFENVGQNKSKISGIMEYDAGGYKIISSIGNFMVRQTLTSERLCKDTITIVKMLQKQEEQLKQEKQKLMKDKTKSRIIKNGLVLNICISKYGKNGFEDLEGPKNDMNKLIDLWENRFGYKTICNDYDKNVLGYYVSKKDFLEKLDECRKLLRSNNNNNYDRLIFVFSGH